MSKFSAPIRGIGFAAVVAGCLAMLTLAGRAEETAPSASVSIGTGTACRAPTGTVGGRENALPDSVTTDRGGDGGQESSLRGSAAPAIDALLSGIYPPNAPGATAIVVKDGRVVLRKAYGLANVELQVPMQPESVLALASLSKQFTAAAILKLAEEGRLSVRDEITRFLPTYPTHGHKVTIEHLLTHTSGLNALSETSDLRAVNVQEGRLIDVLGDWVKDLPPDAAPGERWAYSNWGYNLLGAIVEQVSGQSLWDYLRQQIFEPLGMSHTFYADRRQIIPLRATGYATQADRLVNVLPSRSRIFHPSGAGGLLSTVDDLARWDEALRVGTPVSRSVNLVFFSDKEARDLRAAVERQEPQVMPAAERVRKAADLRLAQGPWSVTSARPKDTTASAHDFYSEGPYWWPDPKKPGGPYIRRDGQVNPDRFTANDNDMGSMSGAVSELAAAAWLYRDQRYADHAAKIVRTWFVDPATRMNPNLEFGQAIRGVTTGRGTGIIDSVPLVWAVQGLALLERSGLWAGADRDVVRQWFAEYLRWMTTSPKGLEEKKSGNNHSTWWAVQAAAFAIYAGDESRQTMVWDFYRDVLVPGQFKPDGSAPREEARTRSLSYSAMNLNAFSLLCHLAERRNVDLWDVRTSAGVSMLQAVAYLAPFVSRPQTWRHQQITPYSPGGAYFLAVFGRGLHRPEYVDLYQKLGPHTGTWSDLLALLLLQSP